MEIRHVPIIAAILAGGLGTRLRPVLDDSPKVLAPVAQRPFITYLLDQLVAAGIRKTILLTGYQAAQVRETLGSRYGNMTLSYSQEAKPLGTGGALRQALPKLDTGSLLLMNGDSFCEVDLPLLIREHRRREADLSLTLAHVPDAGRFGQVRMNDDGKLIHFGEKQSGTGPGWINAGIYVMERSLVQEIAPDRYQSLENDLFPRWIECRRSVGFPCTGRFLDIGTPASYASADAFFGMADSRFLLADSNLQSSI
jgi:D-glycero-alpha-D-manno-heptose 1-phosphate guanylyltransferase